MTRTDLARILDDPDTLPLLFNVDTEGHRYAHDLLDLAQEPPQ